MMIRMRKRWTEIKIEPVRSYSHKPGKLHIEALDSISERSLDDGVLGLNDRSKKIGEYTYSVDGDTLHVFDSKGEVKSKGPSI